MKETLTEEARQLRNAYYREWAKKNRDKRRRSQEKYWEKRAAEAKEKQLKNEETNSKN